MPQGTTIRHALRPGRWSSLGTAFAVSFAAVAATVTVLVGFLSYDVAARLVRVDEQKVFSGVVRDTTQGPRETAPAHLRPAA